MDEGSRPTPRTTLFRSAISAFINERKESKLKGNDDLEAANKYDYATWLGDAARRVAQIQAVTHVLKATHPDARGSSLHVPPSTLPAHREVGSHLLGDHYADDIVGNAAALDVYKFLKVDVDGRRLLDWLQGHDTDLLQALSPDPATANEWASAFRSLVRPAAALASHGLAKQVYWCVSGEPGDDAGFHLLQPLFSSSLAHTVHQDINDARFGESNKAARQARRDGKLHDRQYHDYRQLLVRKLGGTKPQNISQLNSERGGVNYLLASRPPVWQQGRPRPLLHVESSLDRFRRHGEVKSLIRSLCALMSRPGTRNLDSETERNAIEQALGEALAEFGLLIREQLEPGWTRHPACKLAQCEQLWLDPQRGELEPRQEHQEEDEAFRLALEWNDWPAQVALRFGQWLNAILRKKGFPVSDVEQQHWARQAIIDADQSVQSGMLSLASEREETFRG